MTDYPSHDSPAHDAAALPTALPTKLIGRDAVLAQVYSQLKQGTPVLIHGAPGTGKTALAAALATAYTQQPGGVLWLNVDNDSLESLIVRVGRAYALPEITGADNPLAMVGAAANVLMQHKPLIVLDGRISAQIAAKFISRCADRLPVLIASRELLEGAWEEIRLPLLEPAFAVALFKQEALINDTSHDAAIAPIVKTLSYQPFAICVAARAMLAAKQSPEQFNAALSQAAAQQEGASAATLALSASFAPLNAALQGLILVLGATFSGEATGETLSLISGVPEDTIHQAMNMLASLRIVERLHRYSAPYYRLHVLTHAFAQERLKSSNRLEPLQNKAFEALLGFAKKHATGASANDSNKLAAEFDHLIAAARWAAAAGKRDLAAQIPAALANSSFLLARGYSYDLSVMRSAAGTGAAFPAHPQAAPEPPKDVFAMLDAIGEDDIDDSYALDDAYEYDDEEEALETLPDDEELLDESAAFEVKPARTATPAAPEDISSLFAHIDDPIEDESAVLEDDSAALFKDDDLEDDIEEDDELAEQIMSAPARAAIPVPEPADELSRLRAQLSSARQHGDARQQAAALLAIGKLQVSQARDTEAIATYTEVLSVYESLNDKRGQLDALEMLAALTEKIENAQASILHAGRGVKLAAELNDTETQMQLLITLGDAHQQVGESDEAEKSYMQALEITRTRDDTQHEALILYKLGYAQLDGGDPQIAVDNWEQALTLFRGQARREYEGKVMGALGVAFGELDRWAEAINFHTSALYIAREVHDREEEALQLASLGYACMRGGQLPQALLRYRQALHLAYQSGDRNNIVSTIVDLVRLLMRSPRHLSVCELLVEDALNYDSMDKDLIQLEEEIAQQKLTILNTGTPLTEIRGTAQDYAANAYKLLDE